MFITMKTLKYEIAKRQGTNMTKRRTLRIIEDTRQQISRAPLFPAEAKGRWTWDIEVVTGKLDTGDYSLEGWTGRGNLRPGICIEWKRSIDEIAGNLKNDESAGRHERDRFKREVVRMMEFQRRIIVICQPFEWIHNPPPGIEIKNHWNPDSLAANLDAIQEVGVAVKFMPNEQHAALYVTEVVRRFAEKKRDAEEGDE